MVSALSVVQASMMFLVVFSTPAVLTGGDRPKDGEHMQTKQR